MIQPVYLVVVPGADRVYVSTTYPESFVKQDPRSRVFQANIELRGLEKVDGVLSLVAEEITLFARNFERSNEP